MIWVVGRNESHIAERECGLAFLDDALLPGYFTYEPWLGGWGWLVRQEGRAWRVDEENRVVDRMARLELLK